MPSPASCDLFESEALPNLTDQFAAAELAECSTVASVGFLPTQLHPLRRAREMPRCALRLVDGAGAPGAIDPSLARTHLLASRVICKRLDPGMPHATDKVTMAAADAPHAARRLTPMCAVI